MKKTIPEEITITREGSLLVAGFLRGIVHRAGMPLVDGEEKFFTYAAQALLNSICARQALEKIAGLNDTAEVLNPSLTMIATGSIAKKALTDFRPE